VLLYYDSPWVSLEIIIGWTFITHMFGHGPDVKMVVQNLDPPLFTLWPKTAYFLVTLWRHSDFSANIFGEKQAVDKRKKSPTHIHRIMETVVYKRLTAALHFDPFAHCLNCFTLSSTNVSEPNFATYSEVSHIRKCTSKLRSSNLKRGAKKLLVFDK